MKRSAPASESVAGWLAAIGEPTRLALIRVLAADARTVTDLARRLGTEIVNASHHLKVMRDAGLVTAQKDGRFVIYALAGAAIVAGRVELAHASGVKVSLALG